MTIDLTSDYRDIIPDLVSIEQSTFPSCFYSEVAVSDLEHSRFMGSSSKMANWVKYICRNVRDDSDQSYLIWQGFGIPHENWTVIKWRIFHSSFNSLMNVVLIEREIQNTIMGSKQDTFEVEFWDDDVIFWGK